MVLRIMALWVDDWILVQALLTFWLPATIAHLIAFITANLDDIIFDWKVFWIGDVASYAVLAGVTYLNYVFHWPGLIIWIYYLVHVLIITTVASDASMYQETISVSNFKAIFKETLIESIGIPWIIGLAVGTGCYFLFNM